MFENYHDYQQAEHSYEEPVFDHHGLADYRLERHTLGFQPGINVYRRTEAAPEMLVGSTHQNENTIWGFHWPTGERCEFALEQRLARASAVEWLICQDETYLKTIWDEAWQQIYRELDIDTGKSE